MKYFGVAVVVFCACFAEQVQAESNEVGDPAPSVDYRGFCAYPCFTQNHIFEQVDSIVESYFFVNSSDPTVIALYINETFAMDVECYMRSGPFFVSREGIEGNETHSLFRCAKYIKYDENADIVIVYASEFAVYKNYPHICDVCNGEGFTILLVVKKHHVVIVPDLGCNLPLVCPVTNPEEQVQCTCADTFDSGFCCP